MNKMCLKAIFVFLVMIVSVVSSLEIRGGGHGGGHGGGMSRGGGMRGGGRMGGGRQFSRTGGIGRNGNRRYGNRNYYGDRGGFYGDDGVIFGAELGAIGLGEELIDGDYYDDEDEDSGFYNGY